jgi:DNA polymerase-3 subunit delta'
MKELYPWQVTTWQTLQGLRARLPNAILLQGAQGIGKFDLAVNFAQSLLCETPRADGLACQTCSSCRWFLQDSHPDYRLIQSEALNAADEVEEKASAKKPSKEISVEQIRQLANFTNLSAHRGGYRLIVINPAESMNTNSANSLLKTLEEPTDKLLFILVTHKPQQLLPTILSRCLSVPVSTPSAEVGAAWLAQQGISQAHNLLAQSGFAPLLALQWQAAGEGAEERAQLLAAISQPAQLDVLALAESLQRSSPVTIVHCLQQWCYDLASAKLTGVVRYFPEQSAVLQKLGAVISTMNLLSFHKELLIARKEAFHPLNARLKFESLLFSYRQLFAKAG